MKTDRFIASIQSMIAISDRELDEFVSQCYEISFGKNDWMAEAGNAVNDIFFINRGLLRVVIDDMDGNEHSIHFAFENQYITDYAAYLNQTPSIYRMQALEDTDLIVMPRSMINWGYEHLAQGDRMGRLIAETYFLYFDNRIKDQYLSTPIQRYEKITEIFPDIHNRVPQHMIASYLGITPVHLSRIKRQRHQSS
ncbi:MAG TPA: Crp/Fnr family transcriptional regulator [Luteibaculaceae bacterium]|nr:Crp/Fnr family transcriptional regulator [Luteibaculaceae bacterium]